VSFRVRVRFRFGFGIGNVIGGAVGTVGTALARRRVNPNPNPNPTVVMQCESGETVLIRDSGV